MDPSDPHANPISSERKSELKTVFSLILPPAVVSVCPVGFGHLVHFILLLDNISFFCKCCKQLLGQFLMHVHASVFVLPALFDHPFHCQEASSFLSKRDGNLRGVGDQTEHHIFLIFINDRHWGLFWLSTCLVELSTFLYAGQPNNGFTVVQSLVKDAVGVTLKLFLLPLWYFVVFLYLFSLYVFQGLEEERKKYSLFCNQTSHNLFQ